MNIRAKLALATTGLITLATLAVAFGVIALWRGFAHRDSLRRLSRMESYAEKAARDALIQDDNLILVSNLSFLRSQFPALTGARVLWREGRRSREIVIGDSAPAVSSDVRVLSVSDPGEPARRVDLRLSIDRDELDEYAADEQWRLVKIIGGVGTSTILLGLVLAVWLANNVTAPVLQLDRLAASIAEGRLGANMEWDSQDEIGRLVRSFNVMSRRLEELDEAKKNFISSVTHELRSPLGAMESFLHLIEGRVVAAAGPDGEQCQEYLRRIKLNIERLSRFINDLLDVAKIEKGRMECSLRPMDLEQVVIEVCQFFLPKARQQGVALCPHFPQLPEVVGDPDRLRQVLVNLISNALKFTPPGGSVTIEGRPFREESRGWVEITVRDTGTGMEEKDLGLLFQAFQQGPSASERMVGSTKGTGLGLYIAKSIVEQHGGRIGVTSAPGRGTAVSFSLATA